MAIPAASALPFADLRQIMQGFQESRILLTAVELDLFTAVGSGAGAAQVAARIGTHPGATETLLNALAAIGALSKNNGVFHNTPDSARYLVAGSPENAQPALMHTAHLWKSWSTLTECVRAGTAVQAPGIEARDPRWTRAFIAAMHRNASETAAQVVRTVGADAVGRMLDVGGGSGAYSIAFAKANSGLHAEVFDVASVVPIARKRIGEASLSDRVTTRVGDLRSDRLGEGYDLVLLSAICHMLSPEENQDLFRRSWQALTPGGRLVIRDFILEADKTAPKFAAVFAINMLVGTKGGSSYSEAEYKGWLTAAGFPKSSRPDPAGDLLVATR